jgi:mRNA-degrading endonuclease RelE of RelBE toxin-antitoxin system
MHPSEAVAKAATAFQIVFNDRSANELAALPKNLQLEIMAALNLDPASMVKADSETYGRLERDGRHLFRFRSGEYRIYFERTAQGIVVHRILHKNTLTDFLFRSNLPLAEDEELQRNPEFWKLIDDDR